MKDISLEEIVNLDVDKYADWLLSGEAVSEEDKKGFADRLAEHYINIGNNKEDAERRAIADVYVNTKYWQPPTEDEKNNFPFWRSRSFDSKKRFYFTYDGSPLPVSSIAQGEFERLADEVNTLYPDHFETLYFGQRTECYYDIATLIGIIDYLKWIPKGDKQEAPPGPVPDGAPAKNVVSHAIKHVYLAKVGKPGVTKTNKDTLAAKDGCAGNSLFKQYRYYSDDSNRLNLNGNKRSDGQLIKNFGIALDLLKNIDKDAGNMAKRDFASLSKKYDSRHL